MTGSCPGDYRCFGRCSKKIGLREERWGTRSFECVRSDCRDCWELGALSVCAVTAVTAAVSTVCFYRFST